MVELSLKEKQRVKSIIAESIGYDESEVEDDSNLETELCCDSLDKLELIAVLEDSFYCSIDESEVENIRLVSDIYEILEKTIK